MAVDIEQELANDIVRFVNSPLGFVRYAFDWGRGELAGHEGPDEWQVALMLDIEAQLTAERPTLDFATAAGHGVGKSALVAWLALWAMSTRPDLAGVITANTAGQLRDKTWAELARWHKRAINAHWFKWTATKFFQPERPETWFISATPWSKDQPEAFAGLHAKDVLIIMDEASAIPDIIWEVSDGSMTTAGAMRFCFGNPTRNTGRFRECFGRFRHRWIARQVDGRTAKMADQAKIAQWIDDYGEDSDFVRVRVKGVFPRAGSCQLIGSDLVSAAMGRHLPSDLYAHAPKIMGVDVARFGDDQSVVSLRQGLMVKPLLKFRGLDTMTLAGRVAQEIDREEPAAVFVDVGGLGAGVVDRLRQLGYRQVIEVNFGGAALNPILYLNKRSEMWGLMRDWLKQTCALPDDRELEADLTGPEYGFTGDKAQMALEKKDDMKKRGLASPDCGDALALTFAQPVMSREMNLPRKAVQRSNLYA